VMRRPRSLSALDSIPDGGEGVGGGGGSGAAAKWSVALVWGWVLKNPSPSALPVRLSRVKQATKRNRSGRTVRVELPNPNGKGGARGRDWLGSHLLERVPSLLPKTLPPAAAASG